MPDVALAAPNEASAEAGEAVARAGGNAVDVALAAALVTMVNEVGIVSLSSGGFITVQPPDGSAPVTVDGWMDMPGRGMTQPPGPSTEAGPTGQASGAGPWTASRPDATTTGEVAGAESGRAPGSRAASRPEPTTTGEASDVEHGRAPGGGAGSWAADGLRGAGPEPTTTGEVAGAESGRAPGGGAGPWAAESAAGGAGPWAADGHSGAGPWAAESAAGGAGPWAADGHSGAGPEPTTTGEVAGAESGRAPGGGAGPWAAEGTSTWDVETEYGGGVTITIGPGSVATHGAIAGFAEAHRRWGRLPWRELVRPAIDVARGGFRLGSASRYYLEYVHDDVFGWDRLSRAAVHDQRQGYEGEITTDLVVVPDLAESLEVIAAEGASALYTGDLAQLIADDVQGRGGLLSRADLAAYRPVVRPSLQAQVGDWTLGTNPPPAVGGVCVAAMLRLLDGRPREIVDGHWSADDVAYLERVQRAVLGHRLDVLDHSDDLGRDAAALLRLVSENPETVMLGQASGSTAHVSATDTDGGACSVTISSGYGSGMMAAGTGIWLNNCLGEQELNPAGLHGLPAGTRLLSNMAPTVGRHRDGAALAIGSPGADRISTAITQVLAGFAAGGLSMQQAVNHPRLHVHRAGRPDEVVKRETDLTMYYGGVGATLLRRGAEGVHLEAAADPRRDGAVRLIRSAETPGG